MKVVINAVSSKRGGAVTYLSNMLPELRRQMAPTDELIVWRAPPSPGEAQWPADIGYREDLRSSGSKGAIGGGAYRVWFDQVKLPGRLKKERADVLFSSSNFGPIFCPCRQVLLVRNTAYFDPEFLKRMKDLRVKAYYLFQRWLTLRSMTAADVVLFPTKAMLDLVGSLAGGCMPHWRVASYGTRPDLLHPRTPSTRNPAKPIEILNVSFYSDQKNFGTLLAAVQVLEEQQPRSFRLTTTAGFHRDWLGRSRFFPAFPAESALFKQLEARGAARESPWASYEATAELYRSVDVFVFPSYTESFGHPLVEAMASGLPIVAADTPVNREICGVAALYFPTFDATACAAAIRRVVEDKTLSDTLRAAAIIRARDFTWERHVRELLSAFRK